MRFSHTPSPARDDCACAPDAARCRSASSCWQPNRLQHVRYPVRQMRMETVIDPLALTAIFQHAAAAQHRQVTGNFRLAFIQRAGQLAHAQLAFAGDEQGDAHASLVSQAFEYGGRCQVLDHENTLLTRADRLVIAKRMRRRIYCLTNMRVKRRLLDRVLQTPRQGEFARRNATRVYSAERI